jgi:hypothetical protein
MGLDYFLKTYCGKTAGQFREEIIEKMIVAGYKRTGMRKAIRAHIQRWIDEEWEGFKETSDYEDLKKEVGGTPTPFMVSEVEPSIYPIPTAWKEYVEHDHLGREWVIFECVEPSTSTISEDKIFSYGKLWFDFDARDELIHLRVKLMDEYGQLSELRPELMFYQGDRKRCAFMKSLMGHVTEEDFRGHEDEEDEPGAVESEDC